MSQPPIETLDLLGVPCPQNTARALMSLELLDEGERLLLLIDDGEPYENVPESLEIEGHRLISIERQGAGWRLLVERGEE